MTEVMRRWTQIESRRSVEEIRSLKAVLIVLPKTSFWKGILSAGLQGFYMVSEEYLSSHFTVWMRGDHFFAVMGRVLKEVKQHFAEKEYSRIWILLLSKILGYSITLLELVPECNHYSFDRCQLYFHLTFVVYESNASLDSINHQGYEKPTTTVQVFRNFANKEKKSRFQRQKRV